MTEILFAAAILLASVTLTYFFCVRPMLKGNCSMGHTAGSMDHSGSATDEGAELARLRAEVATLRAASPAGRVE